MKYLQLLISNSQDLARSFREYVENPLIFLDDFTVGSIANLLVVHYHIKCFTSVIEFEFSRGNFHATIQIERLSIQLYRLLPGHWSHWCRQPYIDDALDLIEFANGGTDTKWGKLRADMGHPAPFNLQQIGVGNEQWGPLYPVRLEKFMKAIRAKYPKMKIVGTSGPSPDDNDGKQFSYGWEQMKKLKADLVDEHYYRDQDWFMNNVTRYDNYDRKGPKVFAGEYACHVKEDPADFPTAKNVFEAALAEAAIMTGFERNADIVHMATYAPLFAHVEGWQWRPDLIWMDNLTTVRTPNYYVQQLYGQNPGTHVLSLLEGKKPVTGQDGLCASAVYDKNTNGYIVKMTNTSTAPKEVVITFKGIKSLGNGKVTTLHADRMDAANTIEKKNNVVPKTADVQADGNVLRTTIPAKTFAVYRF